MDLNEIKDLLTLFDQSTLTEFNLKDGSFELYLNKNSMSRAQTTQVETVAQPQPVAAAPVAQTVQPAPVVETAEQKPVVAGTEIVSPLVGVAYLKPSPDKPTFKQVGDHVAKGDVVCIVEAMKVMNEITSDVSGEIVEVLVENEQVVEFNQPLFIVKEG